MKQKGKIWIDADGREVPSKILNLSTKAEEKASQKIARLALLAEKALQNLVEAAAEEYEKLFDVKMQEAEIRKKTEPGKNMTITSYDHTIECKLTRPNVSYFDETFTEAVKEKFAEYFDSFKSDDDVVEFLRELVTELLFSSSRSLDMSKVFLLRRHRDQINSNKRLSKNKQAFIDAVDLFDKAIRRKPGNSGLFVSIADKPGDKKRRVNLKYTDV